MAHEMRKWRQEVWIFAGYLSLIVWLPVPLGSNRDWSWSLFELASFLLLAWSLLLVFYNHMGRKVFPFRAEVIFFLIVLLLGYVIFQQLPLNVDVLLALSPSHGEIMDSTMISLNSSVSLDSDVTRDELLKVSAYFSMFLLTFLLVTSAKRAKILLYTFALSGAIQAIYGLSQVLGQISQGDAVGTVDHLKGTFVNKNSFGAYLNYIIASVLGLFILEVKKLPDYRLKLNTLGGQSIAISVLLLVLVIAMGFTQSRGASISMAIALSIVAILFTMNPTRRTYYGRNYLVVSLIVVAIFFLIPGNLVSDRLLSIPEDMVTRSEMWYLGWKIVQDFSLFGVGLGNFSVLVPLYEEESMSVYINHAHNDYLELLVELGAVGFLLCASLIVYCSSKATKKIIAVPDLDLQVVNAVGFFGVVTMLLHSAVDFNFHIPSNAAYFYIFLALSVVKFTRRIGQSKSYRKPVVVTQ